GHRDVLVLGLRQQPLLSTGGICLGGIRFLPRRKLIQPPRADRDKKDDRKDTDRRHYRSDGNLAGAAPGAGARRRGFIRRGRRICSYRRRAGSLGCPLVRALVLVRHDIAPWHAPFAPCRIVPRPITSCVSYFT